MSIYAAIAVGGSLGAVSRYWMSTSTYQWLGFGFPYGTLAVNLLGSLTMGFLSELLVERLQVSDEIRIGLLAGFLGSFTTFSTFAIDVLQLGSNQSAVEGCSLYSVERTTVYSRRLGRFAGRETISLNICQILNYARSQTFT